MRKASVSLVGEHFAGANVPAKNLVMSRKSHRVLRIDRNDNSLKRAPPMGCHSLVPMIWITERTSQLREVAAVVAVHQQVIVTKIPGRLTGTITIAMVNTMIGMMTLNGMVMNCLVQGQMKIGVIVKATVKMTTVVRVVVVGVGGAADQIA
jgi:hypothetical protein